jgi:hypothetical protein
MPHNGLCCFVIWQVNSMWSCGSGILYESCNQPRDAYACYVNATRGGSLSPGGPVSPNNNSVNSNGGATLVAATTPGGRVPGGMNPNLEQRIKFLQSHLANSPMPSVTSKWVFIQWSSSSLEDRHSELLYLCSLQHLIWRYHVLLGCSE